MATMTWYPEPEAVAPVEAFDPLYASWTEDENAIFEVTICERFGRTPRYYHVDGARAVTYHRQGYPVRRFA